MNNIRYHHNKYPVINEIVLIKIINKTEHYFNGELLEYNIKCFMNLNDASTKKKIFNWNKILCFNKEMVAKVTNIVNTDLVQISILYLNEYISEENSDIKTNEKIQEHLIQRFNSNKKLFQFIKSFCIKYNYDFKYIWENLFYYIAKINNNNCSLWDYFNNNIDNIQNWVNESETLINIEQLLDYLKEKNNKTNIYQSKFIILTYNGITYIKNIMKKCLDKINIKYSLIFHSPYYIFNTFDNNITQHKLFIDSLVDNIKSIDNSTNIKIIFEMQKLK